MTFSSLLFSFFLSFTGGGGKGGGGSTAPHGEVLD